MILSGRCVRHLLRDRRAKPQKTEIPNPLISIENVLKCRKHAAKMPVNWTRHNHTFVQAWKYSFHRKN